MNHGTPIYSILHIPECTEPILSFLYRKELKSLRLTCRILSLLVPWQSDLFSRAYISCAGRDIRVIHRLSASHLRECVKELVWDITPGPPINERRFLPDPLNRYTLERIMGSWSDDARKGIDFAILLKLFDVFPKLNTVVFTELMGCLVRPLPHNERLYESPTMRSWMELRAGPLPPITAPMETPPNFGMVIRTMNWAMVYMRREVEDQDWIPQLEIGRYMSALYRSPILFLVAMGVLKHSPKRFLVEATSEMLTFHGINHSSWMRKVNIVPSPGATALAGQPYHPLESLQHLSLSLDNRKDGWEDHTNQLLEAVSSLGLRELELSLLKKEVAVNLLLPEYTQMQKLVLKNFAVKIETFKELMLGWCYYVGLENLHLIACEIVPSTERRHDVVQWFIEQHIHPCKAPTFSPSPETEPLDIGSQEFIFYNTRDLVAGGPARQLNISFDRFIVWKRPGSVS